MTPDFDTLRRDLAEALFMEPQDIGMEDELTDLGLDSMLLMTLATGWQERGLNLSFAAFSENLTLAAWQALVDAQPAPA